MAETSNENARMRKFYDLLGNKYGMTGLPDYEKFERVTTSDPKVRQELHKRLKNKGIRVPDDLSKFDELIGVPPAPPEKVSPPTLADNFGGNTVMDAEGNTHVAPSATYAQQPTAEPVAKTPATNNADSTYMSRTPNADTTQVVGAGYAGAPTPTNEEPVSSQKEAPRGKGLIFNDAPQEEGFTPYNERMEQQTAPINELMQENHDLMEEERAYQARQEEFEKEYPEGWQPKTKIEQSKYENALDVLNAQRDLLQARKDALGELSQVGDNTTMGTVIPKEMPTGFDKQFKDESDYNDYVQQVDNANQFVKDNSDKIDKYYKENVLPNMAEEFGDVFRVANKAKDNPLGVYVDDKLTSNFDEAFNGGGVSLERFKEGLDKSVKKMVNDPKLSQFILESLGYSGTGKKSGEKVELTEEQNNQLDRLFGLTYEKVAEQLQNKIYQQYVDAHAPKDALSFIGGSTMRNILVSTIGRAIANQVSESQALRDQLLSQGYAEYGAKHPYQQIAAGVAPFVADAVVLGALSKPFTPLAESATAATATKLGKMALKSAGTPEAAMRAALANPVTGAISRFVGSSIPSAGGFGLYEGLKADAELYMDGNWHGLDEALDAGWEAAKNGAATGFILHAIGGATTELTKAMSIPWRVAGTVGGFVGTSEYFTYTNIQDQIEQLKAKGVTVDFDEKVDWTQARINGYGQNLMFMLTPSHIKGMKERFKSPVGKKFKLEWNEDDAEIIKETYGKEYWDLIHSLVKEDGVVTIDKAGAQRINENLQAILADPNIPKDTKAKLEWITTGRISALGVGFDGEGKFVYNADPESAVYKSVAIDYNEKPSVIMYDNRGNVLSIRRFKTKADAEKHNEEIQSNILSNNVRVFEGMIGDKGIVDAARKQASGNGTPIEEIINKPKSKRTVDENIALDTYLTRLKDVIETMYSDKDAKRVKDNTNQTTGTVDKVLLTDGTEGYVKSEGDGTAVVVDSKTGQSKQVSSGEIISREEPQDPQAVLDKTKQAKEIAANFIPGTTVNVNGTSFGIVEVNPEGLPIAEITGADGSVETRELSEDEVLAISEQMQYQEKDAAENETLDPLQKIQKAIKNGDGELLAQSIEEMANSIESVDDPSVLDELETQVKTFGNEIANQLAPAFEKKREELNAVADSEKTEQKNAEEASTKRLGEIRNLVDSIIDEADLDTIELDDALSENDKKIARNVIEKKRRELAELAQANAEAERNTTINNAFQHPLRSRYTDNLYGYTDEVYNQASELEKKYKDQLIELSASQNREDSEEATSAIDAELPEGFVTEWDNDTKLWRIVPDEPYAYDNDTLHNTNRVFKVGDRIPYIAEGMDGMYEAKVTEVDDNGKVVTAVDVDDESVPVIIDGEIDTFYDKEEAEKNPREKMTLKQRLAEVSATGVLDESRPRSIEEGAAWAVARGFRVDPSSLKKELGSHLSKFGKEGLLRWAKKGNGTIEGVAHKIWESMESDPNVNTNDIRDLLIDYLMGGGSKAAVEDLERMAGVGIENPNAEEDYAKWLKAKDDAEWAEYNEISNEILESELKDLSDEEINRIFAEILEQQINENEQQNGESNNLPTGETEEQQQSGVSEGSPEVGEGEHLRDTDGGSAETELGTNESTGEEGNTEGSDEGIPQVPAVEGESNVKPSVAKPKKPGNNSTREEAQAYFNSVYGEDTPKAKNAMRVWELTHKNRPAAKKDEGLMNKSEMEESQDVLTDEEKAELQMLGIQLGQDFVESGDVKIADFFNTMVSNFGDGIRPFVKSIYMGISANVADDIADEMDDRKVVRAFDINTPVAEESEEKVEPINEKENEGSNVLQSDESVGDLVGGESTGEGDDNRDSGNRPASDNETGNGTDVSGNDGGVPEGKPNGGGGVSSEGGTKDSGSVRSGGSGNRGNRGRKSNGGVRVRGGNKGKNESETTSSPRLTDEEKAKQAEEKAYNEAKEAYVKETNIDTLKSLREGFKKGIQAQEDFLKKAELQGKYRAVTERIKDLLKEQPNANVDITQEKVPYVPVSDPEGIHAIGSVVPSGAQKYLNDAIIKLEEKTGKSVDEFVMEELGYDSLEDMYSDYANGKETGLASEQVDSVGLAINAMKEKRCFIIGDMTGVGKGRQAASIIRWGVNNGKKVIFVTEKPDLFTSMYEDLKDIGTNNLTPFIVNDDAEANITENIEGQYVDVEVEVEEEDEDGNKTYTKRIERQPKKRVVVRHAPKKVTQELYNSDTGELPAINGKGDKKYDFVMMTYSQTGSKSASAQKKLEWLKNYAKDAIIVMDEAHNASGESNTGKFFQDVVHNCEGVTFLSATYAKRPENMALYALRSSMSQINMTKEDFINAISEYGIPMQEILAGALFQSGEMVRRERDFSDVKTHWLTPSDMYDEKEIENLQKTSDMTSNLLKDMIAFQRDNLNPIIDELNVGFEKENAVARLTHNPIKVAKYTPYSGQVSNIFGMMMYGMKSRKTAEMAIQQIKDGKKPVIAVENTLGAYIDALPDGEVEGADFSQVFDRGLAGLTKYTINMYVWDENAKNGKGGYVLSFKQELDAAKDDGVSTSIIEAKIDEYKKNEERISLSLSPIDQIKQMIADAGYKCGEITGRSNALQFNKNGTVTKVPRKTDKKNEMALFNNGGSDAIILNVAGATGISLHSSKRFKDQKPRTMLILQPAKNVNTEVQMRGRIDRTGQEHRGEYFYVTSPIPAEQKIIMMLKQKLASLDANSVGTEDVSSNKVDSQDMDNKYGDEVAKQFLIENQDINAQLDNGLAWNKKLRMLEGHEGLLYDIFIGIQRMDCATQEFVINELAQRYAEQIEYLNQSGINDLKTATMKLDATTIDKAVFVKGKDDESSNYFAHDTNIERVEANVLKKPLRSADILKKMKQYGVFDDNDKIIEDYGTIEIYEKVMDACTTVIDAFKAKQEEALKKFKEGLPAKLKWNITQLTPEEVEAKIALAPSYVQFVEKQAADLSKKEAEIFDMRSTAYNALMNLKPGMPYFVPLTDNVGNDAPLMYGRFIGFETGDYKPRSLKAVFAVKDSRSQVSIPVISQKEAIRKIIDESRYEPIFRDLMVDPNSKSWDVKELSNEEKLKNVDEWWDKMIPKGETNRQIRYMITGNVLQACGAIGKHKGQIVSFTRLDKETGEKSIDKGMLLAEDFDPENFRIKKKVTKESVWSNYSEHKDDDHFISVHRSGDQMVIKFLKQPNKKLSEHPVKSDEELQKLFSYFDARRDELRAWVDEKNVEEVLNQLYDKYSFTADELFVMPDSTEKPDAIVRTNKPYNEVIDDFSGKYGCYGEWDCRNKLKKMLKQYKMDINNEDLKNQIKELSQLYQAYLREKYTKEESVHLAWQAIIYDENAKQALAEDDKEAREKYMRIREAIIEELEYRGFEGHEMHLKQGEWDRKDFVDTFNNLNSNPDNAKRFEKIWDIVNKLDMNIILSEKIANSTGGQAAGKVVEYNWKYMNAKYISDQAKADTILHELTHTVTSYAAWAVKHGYDHLLSADMLQDVNDLKSILNIIKYNAAFTHDGADGKYTDYGVTNEHEILAEISSNEAFRTDLKKVNIIVGTRYGKVAFYEDTPQNEGMAGATKVNAYDAVMEILDRMIAGFNEKAWAEVYKGSQYGGYAYSRFEDQMKKEGKGEQAIKDAENPNAITLLPDEPWSHYVRRVAEAFKGNKKLRKAHLDTAVEYMKAKNDPDAEIKGGIMGFIFDRFEDMGINTWFETQESARRAERKGGIELSKVSDTDIDGLLDNMKSMSESVTPVTLTKELWEEYKDKYFESPIGRVRFGKNQYDKFVGNKREEEFGMFIPTIERPDLILDDPDPEEGAERDSKYLFIKTFVDENKNKYYNYMSVSVRKGSDEVSISSHIIRDSQIKDRLKRGTLLWNRFEDDSNSLNPALANSGSNAQSSPLVGKVDNNIRNNQENAQKLSVFHRADGTIYGWAANNGLHYTLEGLDPKTAIHEYGHAWLAGVKQVNPALYESLMRLAKGSDAWEKVVKDNAYSLSSDDEILSEVFARFSGERGEKELIAVTREAIANGVDMKDKAAKAAEYSRLAKKLDKTWEWTMKNFFDQDVMQFSSMAEAADMLLMDIVSNPNDGGYTPSGKLKIDKNVTQYLNNKNQYSRGGSATSPSDVASYNYERVVSQTASKVEEAWVDYLNSVRTLQESIVKETGKEVHDYENAYLHLQHLSSVNKAEQDKVQHTHIQPLIDAMNDITSPIIDSYVANGMKKSKARKQAMDDLERYMIAKHGIERNEKFARRDAKAKANKEFAERINKAEADLRNAQKDFAAGLINQAELDQKENDLLAIEGQRLMRENNLYAANRKIDYSGFTQTFEDEAKAAGLWDDVVGKVTATNTELEKLAKDYLNLFEGNADKSNLDTLWEKINAVNAYTLEKSLKSGNMSKETYDTVSTQFEYYVPFRGWDATTAEDVYHYMSEGRDKIQPTLKTAKGRKSRAGDILSTMLAMNSSAIIMGNKNLAKQKLLSLVQNNKTSLTSLSHTWYVLDSAGNWNPSYPEDASGNPLTDPQAIADWEQDMKDLQKDGLAKVGHEHFELDKPIKRWQENEHQVRVNRNGKEYVIYINGAPNAAQAINGQLNMDADSANALEKISRTVNPWMARAYTSWNPLFLVRNLQKDIISAGSVAEIKFGKEYTARYAANISQLVPLAGFVNNKTYSNANAKEVLKRGSARTYQLIKKYHAGALDMNNETEKYFQEFMENGGHTGYSMLWNVEEYSKKLDKEIKNANSKIVAQKAKALSEMSLQFVEDINASIEDIARFATYMTSRQSGRSILMSVADAKDASTNFNKKGSGAMGNRLARDLYIFMNPAVQGVTRLVYRAINKDISGTGTDKDFRKNQSLRAMVGFAGIVGWGAMLTLANYLLGIGDGDDEDEVFGGEALGNDYWKLSTFKRRNSMNFYVGSKSGYLTFNLTPEEAVPYSIGTILAEHALGYGHPDQIAPEVISQLSRFSPFGEATPQEWQTWGDVSYQMFKNMLPSTILPLWEVYDNRNFMGGKIHGYDNTLKKGTPKHQEKIHNAIDEVTNGRLGAFGNVNNIEHVAKGYFGGLVEFPVMLFNTVEGLMSEEGVNINETPVKVFWNSTSSKWNETNAIKSEFDYYKSKVDWLEKRLKAKGYSKQAEQAQFVNEHLEDDIDYKYWKAYQNYAKPMNSRKGGVDKDEIMKKAIKDWREIDKE